MSEEGPFSWLPTWLHWLRKPLLFCTMLTSILYILVILVTWSGYLYAEKLDEHDKLSFLDATNEYVATQIDHVTAVSPGRLRGLFTDTLQACDYGWNFGCKRSSLALLPPGASPNLSVPFSRSLEPADANSSDPCAEHRWACAQEPPLTGRNSPDFARGLSAPPSRPLFRMLGPLPIPTLNTILGIPRATMETSKAIVSAGSWTVVLFSIATLIFAMLVLGGVANILDSRQDSKLWSLFILAGMIMAGPVLISGMVWLLQLGLALLLKFVSGFVALLLFVMYVSAAITIGFEFKHLLHTGKEIKEAASILRH